MNNANSRLKWAVAIIAIWAVLGVIYVGPTYMEVRAAQMGHAAWRVFAWGILTWGAWAPLTPAMIWLARRYSLIDGAWKKNLLVHLPAFVVLSIVHSAAAVAIILTLDPFQGMGDSPKAFWPRFLSRALGSFGSDLVVYGAVIGIFYALDYYRKYREREILATRLESQLAQAQLDSLRMQLHPHFLFNTLNGIVGLVRDNKNQAAVSMLVGLSDLLRHTLEHSSRQEVELREELSFIKLYLSIQEMRFSDRLRIEFDIDPQTARALVPNLILQPLTENALRHGIARSVASGVVGITSAVEDGHLRLMVYDNGGGLPDDWQMKGSTGIGLANTAARLQQLYDDNHQFDIRNRDEGGVEVLILMPLRISA
ncbi:MAG TPA: histidine kinase [Pyrinomonadaceae bacterium]|jgi:signal transduction histidine kinase|nr:histidine kinase [Pyrinomonadaceae bacterium]